MAKKEKKTIEENISQTHVKNIEDIMSGAFGRYAKYIIQDRALPDIRDGLKPVQRRIIYAMNDLGITHDKPHKKSARSVGEVIGKYHPHGDSSIYDAMVRMSQDWKNNIPLIDMHGNNGSLDNDPAAAMRYTESRLSLYSEMMISGIKKDTVSFIENFDGSETEPTVLPSLLPNLLINGASGIAAGYATSIPPFNPSEIIDSIIARIDSPNCKLEKIMEIMPGPDFPTGGIILNKEGLIEAYETGRGKINIRAKIELVSKKQAYISEIPYETNKADLIDEINEAADKFDSLNITEAHDETDKDGVSICINLKNSDNFEFTKNFLFKNTQLQISYNLNMVAIKDRKPYLIPILFFLDSFIAHADNIVVRSTTFDLEKSIARREIIVGITRAIKNVDVVIDLIRKSSDKQTAKNSLMEKMKFSEAQAEAIVQLRLYRLSNSDVTSLEKELAELDVSIAELEMILKNKTYRNKHIKSILRGYKKIFNAPRKTSFSDEAATITIDQTEIVEDRDNYLVVTRDGYLKNIPTRSYGASEYKELKMKEGDVPVAQFSSNQRNKLVLITSKGNYVSIPVFKIESTKWKEMGVHINSIINIDSDEKIINAFDYTDKNEDSRILVIATKEGSIKRTKVSDLGISKLTKISTVMGLDENDSLVSCLVTEDNEQWKQVGVMTELGKALYYPLEQISIVGKNAGGVSSNGNKDEKVACIFLNDVSKFFVTILCVQGMKRIKRDSIVQGKRTSKAKPVLSQIKTNPIIVLNAFCTNQNDIINCLFEDHKWQMIKDSEIVIGNGSTRVSLVKNKKIIYSNYLLPLGKQTEPDTKVEPIIEEPTLFDK